MSRKVMYLSMKLIAVFAVAFMRLQANAEKGTVLISALAFSCFFLLQYLCAQEEPKRNLMFTLAGAVGCFLGDIECQLPVLLVVSVEGIDYLTENRLFYQLSTVTGILLLFVFPVPENGLLLSILLFLFTWVFRAFVQHITALREESIKQKQQLQELRKKVTDIGTYAKTIRRSAVMEERKRFTARVHDQLGHGISGSILLLEGARLQMDTDPARAKETIGKAADNLRAGVESIRMALREERPDWLQIGLEEMKVSLEQFQVQYNIETKLVTEGDLSEIPAGVWICAKENLTEALTNVIKHSDADVFTMKIQNFPQMIRLEYRDNGRAEASFAKGMGTEGIEERTLLAGGKCLFSGGEHGFCITNIFLKEGERDGA